MVQFHMIGAEGFGPGKVVAGAPFSADETNTTTQTLVDGNRIVNASTSKVYRDQQGRTRTENTLGNIGGVPASEAHVSIMINDPVAASQFMLNPAERTALKMNLMAQKLEAESMFRATTELTASPNLMFTTARHVAEKPSKTEDIGTQNMEGVLVKGTRTTMTIAAGSMGNDRDINVVTERWYSPELRMNIMTKRTDPRMGETVFQVTNLSRSNPDPSLFTPPADYQMKDAPKASTFSRTINIQK